MENLVVSIFKTESEAYQAFAELKNIQANWENKKSLKLLLSKMKAVILLIKIVLILKILQMMVL